MVQFLQDIERLRSDGLLLTVILSTGEPMPVHYQDQMGSTFVDYLLDYVRTRHMFSRILIFYL